jgi:hypothetical protein
MINGIKCKEELCSRAMLIDGHQKCKRIICQFENVTNMSHPEMRPVVQGRPYAPKRSKNLDDDVIMDRRFRYGCSILFLLFVITKTNWKSSVTAILGIRC